jgi:hypothetical protein
MFNQIISDLREGCGFDIFDNGIYICGRTKTYSSPKSERYKIALCNICQAKLDQTLLCEKMHKDFVEKLIKRFREMSCATPTAYDIIAELDELSLKQEETKI